VVQDAPSEEGRDGSANRPRRTRFESGSQEVLADEYAARAPSAQVEIDIKTVRATAWNSRHGPSQEAVTSATTQRAEGRRGQTDCGNKRPTPQCPRRRWMTACEHSYWQPPHHSPNLHQGHVMNALIVALVVLAIVALIGLSLSVKVVTQYQGVLLSGSARWWVSRNPAWHLIIR